MSSEEGAGQAKWIPKPSQLIFPNTVIIVFISEEPRTSNRLICVVLFIVPPQFCDRSDICRSLRERIWRLGVLSEQPRGKVAMVLVKNFSDFY